MFQRVRFLSYVLVLLATCSVMFACNSGEPPPADAKIIAENFYQALVQKDLDTAQSFLSPKRLPEEWRSKLEHAQRELGDVVSYSFRREEINTVLRGRFFIFEYQVKYSGGETAAETMTLLHKVDEEGLFIVSRVISANGFTSHP